MKSEIRFIKFICTLLFAAAAVSACDDDERDIIPLPPLTPPEATGDKAIAIAEQSRHQVLIVDRTTGETLWDWRAADSGIPAAHQGWFELPDEVKPIYNGEYLLIVGTRGGVGIVRIRDKKMMFYAQPKGQPHSAEVLPDGNVVVASTTDGTADGDKLRLYKVDTVAQLATAPIAAIPLTFGHNAVWDRTNEVLWATAKDVLNTYKYVGAGGEKTLVLQDSYPLPAGETDAHDLFPVYGLNQLWLTTPKAVYKFNVATREFAKVNASTTTDIKSVSSGPADYETIMLRPTQSWWSDKLIDSGGRSIYQHDGFQIYKGRWMLDNTFSYPEKHEFVQPEN